MSMISQSDQLPPEYEESLLLPPLLELNARLRLLQFGLVPTLESELLPEFELRARLLELPPDRDDPFDEFELLPELEPLPPVLEDLPDLDE